MIARSQSCIVKPIDRLSLNTFLISPIPKNPSDSLKDSQWRNAMYDEYNALVKNGTWLLVPRPAVVSNLLLILDETFSPVVTPATIRTVLSLTVSCKLPIHQLDIKNAFLNGDLSETVYMHQPPGLVDVSVLQVAYLLLYVDDIILTASSTTFLKQLIDSLHREFDMIDLEKLNFFGISEVRNSTDTSGYKVQTRSGRGSDSGSYYVPKSCRGLYYLTFTRLDLSYAVQQIFLYMHDPREPHLAALKRILRYVQGTLDLGLHLYASSATSLVGYTDADWAGCPSTCRGVYMPANPVQHQRKKHIEIDIHFIHDMVTAGQFRVLHVPFRYRMEPPRIDCLSFEVHTNDIFFFKPLRHRIRVIVHLMLLTCERMDFVTLWSGEEVTLEMRVNGIRKKYARNMSIEELEA
uniref:Reverse transcriptase Ty1/copia-type domain-containing protein n=1 Tax=Tanacetum cinerariifolium TaxID=118510 RepID=A0A699H0P8_TANCI|nr:hypothetical protein [Tanacetum cinerariifolium]